MNFSSFHAIAVSQPFVQAHNIECKEWLYIVIFLPEESKCIKKNVHQGLEQKEVFILHVPEFCVTQHHGK